MRRKTAVLVLLLSALAVALSACGASSKPTTHADDEGQYFTVNGVRYQVQVSRQLNPRLTEDADYISGVPQSERNLGNDEVFFGVFLRAQNTTKGPANTADQFEIRDTQNNTYQPITVNNPLGYKPVALAGPNDLDPDPNAIASYSPAQGRLILFKVKQNSLANRPLELEVKNSTRPQNVGRVDLDV